MLDVHDWEENEFARSLSPNYDFWIGLRYHETSTRRDTGEWVWTYGNRPARTGYISWVPGKPTASSLPAQDCAFMKAYRAGQALWKTASVFTDSCQFVKEVSWVKSLCY